MGNKETLLSMLDDIEEIKLSTVLICVDRDHDFQLGIERSNKYLLYTYGYSWENDAFNKKIILSLFWRFKNNNDENRIASDKLVQCISQFEKEVRKFCEYDIALISRRKLGLFPRDNPNEMIDRSQKLPRLNIPRLNRTLNNMGYKRGPRRNTRIQEGDELKVTFGHLWARYAYHLFVVIAGSAVGRLSFEAFARMAISEFRALGRTAQLGELEVYYSESVQSAVAR